MVTVKVCNTRIEAEIVRGKLESEGITAFISADDAGGMYAFPFQSGFSGVKVLVAVRDLHKAKTFLDLL